MRVRSSGDDITKQKINAEDVETRMAMVGAMVLRAFGFSKAPAAMAA